MDRQQHERGIRIRLAKDRCLVLTDVQTGQRLANICWRPCGMLLLQLPKHVVKEVREVAERERAGYQQ